MGKEAKHQKQEIEGGACIGSSLGKAEKVQKTKGLGKDHVRGGDNPKKQAIIIIPALRTSE